MESGRDLESLFPNLRPGEYRVTSERDRCYNCIAYAAGRTDVPWWPEEGLAGDPYWPQGVAREESLDAFVAAYGTLGYVSCESSGLELGFEKVAIFADGGGTPKHAARQLASGAWASKLGDLEDIEHKTLEALEGEAYGKPVRFVKRALTARE